MLYIHTGEMFSGGPKYFAVLVTSRKVFPQLKKICHLTCIAENSSMSCKSNAKFLMFEIHCSHYASDLNISDTSTPYEFHRRVDVIHFCYSPVTNYATCNLSSRYSFNYSPRSCCSQLCLSSYCVNGRAMSAVPKIRGFEAVPSRSTRSQ